MSRAVALALAALGGHVRDAPACAPSTVPAAHRCSYVRDNADVCFKYGGIQRYLEVHECFFAPEWWVYLDGHR